MPRENTEILDVQSPRGGKIVKFLPLELTLDVIVEAATKEFPAVPFGDLRIQTTYGLSYIRVLMWRWRG
ncbi:MAG: hypothetical protein WC657_04015 [Candidatus Paceibacterota bacterium]|jgi:hypothetical protein